MLNQMLYAIVTVLSVFSSRCFSGVPHEELTVTLIITADRSLSVLFVDDIEYELDLTSSFNWSHSNQIAIPALSSLIALRASNSFDANCSGILGSIVGADVVTSAEWKCSTDNSPGWFRRDFNDSHWPQAVIYDSNTPPFLCPYHHQIDDISSLANWIWTSNMSVSTNCRAHLVNVAEPMNDTLVVTGYEQIEALYIDGQEYPLTNGNIWNKTDHVGLTKTNRLIAVSVTGDRSTCGGFLASIGATYVLTSAEWKCSEYQYLDWEKLGFDREDEWANAVVVGSNGGGHDYCNHLQFIPDISVDAKWIWVDDPKEETIFCRGYIPICDNSPCLNGGTCLQNDVDLCRCPPQFTGFYCETKLQMSLSITAKSTLYELYIDGVPQSLRYGNNVSAVDEILLPTYGRLIAVTAIDTTSTCGGVLASVTGDYLATDASWKCQADSAPLWYTIGFDDTNWIDSYVIGFNNNVTWPEECRILEGVPAISKNASWIWTSTIVNTPNYDDIIYCRAYLPLCERDSPCQNGGTCHRNAVIMCTCLQGYTGVFCENVIVRTLNIAAKTALLEFYVDGVLMDLPLRNNWTVSYEIELSMSNRLISVLAVDSTSTCAGILASVADDFLVSDASWKCRIGAPPQWYILGFDDSDWTDTYVIGPNGNVSWPEACKVLTEIPTISQNAYWIWTSTIPDVPYYDNIVYCRAYLPVCESESPCQNGGICNENSVNLCACPSGFAGVHCESVVCDGDAPCQNGGTCSQAGDTTVTCLCPPLFTGTFCEFKMNRTLNITAKSVLYELYIDGIQKNLSHGLDWTIPDEVELSPLSRLIAVTAMDGTETCAGILGSVTGENFVTDGINWLCDYIPDPQWFRLGWDDSVWDPAYVVGPNNNVTFPEACKILTGVPTISPAANWIWTDTIPDTPFYHQTVYCRGYLPLCELESPCFNGGTCNKNNQTLCTCLVGYVGEFCETVDTKALTVTAKDSIGGLYVDGAQVSLRNGSNWLETDTIFISSTTRVIAIVAHQLNSSCIGPGILASVTDSLGDYVVTNASWKCSPSAENGWSSLGYDDSSWQPATLVKANSVIKVREAKENSCQEVPVIPTISPDAFWIWTAREEVGLYDVIAFCRGYLPICNVHPCKNGGICNPNSINLCTCQESFTGRYCEIENDAT